MEKVKLKDNWPSFIKQVSSPETALRKLYLTECWPSDQVVEQIASLDNWNMELEEGEFTLNNNCIVLTKN